MTSRAELVLEGSAVSPVLSRVEVLYRAGKTKVKRWRLAYEQLQSLPIQWVDQIEPLLVEASRIGIAMRSSRR